MTEPNEIERLRQQLEDAQRRLAECQSRPDCSAQTRASIEREIKDLNDELRQAELGLKGQTPPSREQNLRIEGKVDVAISGDHHGDIIFRLLPARVPSTPSLEEISKGKELLCHMPVPPEPTPSERRAFLLAGLFPIRHNPLFVGRDAILAALAQRLKPEGARSMVLTGAEGVGKTSLAVEFAHRYGAYFAGGVFWISCDKPSEIANQVSRYGGPGGLELWYSDEELALTEQVARVRRQWESELPRLLIFDQCEDENEQLSIEWRLQEWLPHMGGCRVLMTSRRQDWSPALGVETIALGGLDRSDSIRLLQTLASNLSDQEADRVARALGDLPWLLTRAGGYLHRYRHITTVDQFLSELSSSDLRQHRAFRT